MHIVQGVRAVLAGTVIFLCPGYALLAVVKRRQDLDFTEMVCAAGGFSIVTVPLVLYASTYLGIGLTPGLLVLILLAAGGLCLWDGWQRFRGWRNQGSPRIDLVYLLLGLVFAMTLFARMWMVRGIDYPLWTDSYHHTIITQLISDGGKIPSSYEPYASIDRFTYHFGFHALAAWFHQLSGISVPRSVVLTGQLINAMAVPTSYFLARRLFKDRTAGLVSSLVVGLVSHMPAFFVNWGRYTQLSGQVFLPVLVVLTVDSLDQPNGRTRNLLVASIGAAGLFLVHVRVFLFFGLFAGLLFLFRLVTALRQHKSNHTRRLLISALALTGITLLITGPWLWRFFEGFGSAAAQELASEYRPDRYGTYFRWRAQDLLEYGLRSPLLILAVAGGVLGLVNRVSSVWLLVVWFLSLFGVANLHRIGVVPPFTNLIASKITYLPGAALIGYLAGQSVKMAARLGGERRQLTSSLRLTAIAGTTLICIAGAVYTVRLIRPQNGFVRQADLEAMGWIRQHVPDDGLFYVSTHFWTPLVAHGLDGGYWIPWLADRRTILPPEVYASDGSPEQMESINRRARELLEAQTPGQLWEVMMRYGVTHVYIGRRPTELRADFFLADPAHFSPLYSADGVWVFQVNRRLQQGNTLESPTEGQLDL